MDHCYIFDFFFQHKSFDILQQTKSSEMIPEHCLDYWEYSKSIRNEKQ